MKCSSLFPKSQLPHFPYNRGLHLRQRTGFFGYSNPQNSRSPAVRETTEPPNIKGEEGMLFDFSLEGVMNLSLVAV